MANIPFLNNAYFAAKVGIGTGSPGYNLVVGDGTTDTESRFYHNDASYTSVRGYGLFMSRVNSYIRPTTEGTQTLWIGASNATWNYVSVDTNQFQVQKDGTSRLYINSDGNVGIGTTSPDSQLEVHYAPAGNTGAQIKLGSGDVGYETTITNYRRLTDSTFEIASYDDTILGYNRATSKTWLGIGSNVGIGTTSPSQKLDVQGGNIEVNGVDSYSKVFLSATGLTSGRIELGQDSDLGYLNTTNANVDFQIRNQGNSLMHLDSTGKVGIGTTTPQHKLEVFEVGNSLSIGDNSNAQTYMSFSGTRTMIGYSGANALIQGGLGKGIQFNVNNDTFNSGEAMRITSAGNVGIGTTSPDDKLDVNGRTTSKAFRTYTTNTDYNLLTRNSSGNATLYVQAATSNTNQAIAQFNHGSATANAGQKVLLVAKDNSHFLNTNVGIGTDSPEGNLHVVGATGDQGRIYVSDKDAGENSTDSLLITKSGTNSFIYNRDSGDLNLGSNDQSSYVAIKSDGNVGIGTTSPTASALFEVASTTKGVLLPRMNTTQINAISSPAEGLTVYNTLLSTLCFFNGVSWQKVTSTAM